MTSEDNNWRGWIMSWFAPAVVTGLCTLAWSIGWWGGTQSNLEEIIKLQATIRILEVRMDSYIATNLPAGEIRLMFADLQRQLKEVNTRLDRIESVK